MTIRRSGGAAWSTSNSGHPQLHWPHRTAIRVIPPLPSIRSLLSVTDASSITREPATVNEKILDEIPQVFMWIPLGGFLFTRYPVPVYQIPRGVSLMTIAYIFADCVAAIPSLRYEE